MKICSVEGCNKKHEAKGYCTMHYQRLLRHGDPLYVKNNKSLLNTCKIEGCENTNIASNELCWKHYQRFLKYGNPHEIKTMENKGIICSVESCDKEAYAKGFCDYHYHKSLKLGDPTIKTRVKTKGKFCKVKECNINVYAKGLCQNHYRSFNRYKKSKDIVTIEEYLKIIIRQE
jgi:hypothetical protein